MKRLFFLITAFIITASLAAGPIRKAELKSRKANTTAQTAATDNITSLDFQYYVGCYYSVGVPAEYYGILSTDESTKYNAANATMTTPAGSWVLYLDFFADPTSPVELPAGIYKEVDYSQTQDYSSFTYDPYYTRAARFDSEGRIDNVYILFGDVNVTKSGNTYTVTGKGVNEIDGSIIDISYTGVLPMSNVADVQTAYPQLKRNLTENVINEAMGIYYGNLLGNNTGVLQLGLTTAAYDKETGAMQGNGVEINTWLIGSLFKDAKKAHLIPGTYKIERTGERFSAYPGLEINYMGIPIVYGSYVRERDAQRYGADEPSVYGYLKEGTILIEEVEQGYHIVIDAMTNLGFVIKADYTGGLGPILDQHTDTGGAAVVSTLEEDVDLDLDYMPRAHVMSNGIINGCQSFILDIGGDTSYEEKFYWEHYDEAHDAMRIEFLLAPNATEIQEGTYSVLEDRHNPACYKPFKLEQGYFTAPTDHDSGGYPSGTRYMGFYKYLYMDHHAPAAAGTVGVTKNADGTYTFVIDIQDDGNFFVRGKWTGELVLHYNANDLDAIDGIPASDPYLIDNDNSSLSLGGIDASTRVTVTSLSGATVFSAVGASRIDISSLTPAVYILSVGNQAIKFIKK